MAPTHPGAHNTHLLSHVRLGDAIEVWWPYDSTYYPGVVSALLNTGHHRILYDDGEVEDLQLCTEQWRFRGAAAGRVTKALVSPRPTRAPPLDAPSPSDADAPPLQSSQPHHTHLPATQSSRHAAAPSESVSASSSEHVSRRARSSATHSSQHPTSTTRSVKKPITKKRRVAVSPRRSSAPPRPAASAAPSHPSARKVSLHPTGPSSAAVTSRRASVPVDPLKKPIVALKNKTNTRKTGLPEVVDVDAIRDSSPGPPDTIGKKSEPVTKITTPSAKKGSDLAAKKSSLTGPKRFEPTSRKTDLAKKLEANKSVLAPPFKTTFKPQVGKRTQALGTLVSAKKSAPSKGDPGPDANVKHTEVTLKLVRDALKGVEQNAEKCDQTVKAKELALKPGEIIDKGSIPRKQVRSGERVIGNPTKSDGQGRCEKQVKRAPSKDSVKPRTVTSPTTSKVAQKKKSSPGVTGGNSDPTRLTSMENLPGIPRRPSSQAAAWAIGAAVQNSFSRRPDATFARTDGLENRATAVPGELADHGRLPDGGPSDPFPKTAENGPAGTSGPGMGNNASLSAVPGAQSPSGPRPALRSVPMNMRSKSSVEPLAGTSPRALPPQLPKPGPITADGKARTNQSPSSGTPRTKSSLPEPLRTQSTRTTLNEVRGKPDAPNLPLVAAASAGSRLETEEAKGMSIAGVKEKGAGKAAVPTGNGERSSPLGVVMAGKTGQPTVAGTKRPRIDGPAETKRQKLFGGDNLQVATPQTSTRVCHGQKGLKEPPASGRANNGLSRVSLVAKGDPMPSATDRGEDHIHVQVDVAGCSTPPQAINASGPPICAHPNARKAVAVVSSAPAPVQQSIWRKPSADPMEVSSEDKDSSAKRLRPADTLPQKSQICLKRGSDHPESHVTNIRPSGNGELVREVQKSGRSPGGKSPLQLSQQQVKQRRAAGQKGDALPKPGDIAKTRADAIVSQDPHVSQLPSQPRSTVLDLTRSGGQSGAPPAQLERSPSERGKNEGEHTLRADGKGSTAGKPLRTHVLYPKGASLTETPSSIQVENAAQISLPVDPGRKQVVSPGVGSKATPLSTMRIAAQQQQPQKSFPVANQGPSVNGMQKSLQKPAVRPKSTGRVTQNAERGTASLPLDILMRTITESNIRSLQTRLAPLGARIDQQFAKNEDAVKKLGMDVASYLKQNLRLASGQEVLRKAMEQSVSKTSLISAVSALTSKIMSTVRTEMNTVAKKLRQEVAEDMAEKLKTVSVNLREDIRKDTEQIVANALQNALSVQSMGGFGSRRHLAGIHPSMNGSNAARIAFVESGASAQQKLSAEGSKAGKGSVPHGTGDVEPKDGPSTPQPSQFKMIEYEKVAGQARELVANAVVEWMLSGGSRDLAPNTERHEAVSLEWVESTVRACLMSVSVKLDTHKRYDEALEALKKSRGHVRVEGDWLIKGPSAENLTKARRNYSGWDPCLLDFEWESERRVLQRVAEELILTEKSLLSKRMRVTEALLSAVRCVQVTLSRLAGGW